MIITELLGKLVDFLAGVPDKAFRFGKKVMKTITPSNIVKAGKAVAAASVFYSVVIKKTVPFLFNLWKGTRKENRPIASQILALRHNDKNGKDAKIDLAAMTQNAVKTIKEDIQSTNTTERDFFGQVVEKDNKFKMFDKEDQKLLNDLRRRTSKEHNDETAKKEVFVKNTPKYLDKVIGREEEVELPSIKNKYFRDYMSCTGGARRPLRYNFNDEYITIEGTIFTPAVVADVYMEEVKDVTKWLRSNRKNPNNATVFEYQFYNEMMPAVAYTGFNYIKKKHEEKALSLGEFKKALNWIVQNATNFIPDNSMQFFTTNN